MRYLILTISSLMMIFAGRSPAPGETLSNICKGNNFHLTYVGNHTRTWLISLQFLIWDRVIDDPWNDQERLDVGGYMLNQRMPVGGEFKFPTVIGSTPFEIRECQETHVHCELDWATPAACKVSYSHAANVDRIRLLSDVKYETIDSQIEAVDRGTTYQFSRSETYSQSIALSQTDTVSGVFGIALPLLTATITKQLETQLSRQFERSVTESHSVGLDGNICGQYRVLTQRRIRLGEAHLVDARNPNRWVRFQYIDGIRLKPENLCAK